MSNATSEHGMLFTLSGEQTPRLTIQHLNGDIKIEGWERPAIAIQSDDEDEDTSLADILNVVQQGNEVRVNLDFSGQAGRMAGKFQGEDFGKGWENLRRMARHFGRGMHLDLQIAVPHTCDITVRSMNGDIELRRVQGKLFLENANGDMTLDEVRGNVLLKSAAGDIEVRHLQGRLGMRTASGDLTIRESELGALSVGTASGDIEIHAALRPTDDYEVQTVSGDVRFAIPTDTRARIEIETVSGDIECGLPHQTEKLGRRHRMLELNGGGDTRVRIRTTSGDINIDGAKDLQAPTAGDDDATAEGPVPTRRFSPGETAAAGAALAGDAEHFRAAPAAAHDAPDEGGRTQRLSKSAEMTILEAIESGEMSVDDGLRRLNELAQ